MEDGSLVRALSLNFHDNLRRAAITTHDTLEFMPCIYYLPYLLYYISVLCAVKRILYDMLYNSILYTAVGVPSRKLSWACRLLAALMTRALP